MSRQLAKLKSSEKGQDTQKRMILAVHAMRSEFTNIFLDDILPQVEDDSVDTIPLVYDKLSPNIRAHALTKASAW